MKEETQKREMNWDYYAIKYILGQRTDEKSKQVLLNMENMTNEEFNQIWWDAKVDLFLDRF